MKRTEYENYKWYDVTDENYWVEEYPEEFPNCVTIVHHPEYTEDNILTKNNAYLGWGTMAKYEGWKFMIIELSRFIELY